MLEHDLGNEAVILKELFVHLLFYVYPLHRSQKYCFEHFSKLPSSVKIYCRISRQNILPPLTFANSSRSF